MNGTASVLAFSRRRLDLPAEAFYNRPTLGPPRQRGNFALRSRPWMIFDRVRSATAVRANLLTRAAVLLASDGAATERVPIDDSFEGFHPYMSEPSSSGSVENRIA
jgi:hypothetical protein